MQSPQLVTTQLKSSNFPAKHSQARSHVQRHLGMDNSSLFPCPFSFLLQHLGIMQDPFSSSTYLISYWPDDGTRLTLPQALQAAGQEELVNSLAASSASLEMAQKLGQHPIIAVTGQLNAGKSSVVASFLSPAGQARVPRGSGSDTGTHRFVYWVPQQWLDDPDLKSLLLDLLKTAHPNGVEFLEKDPAKAADQYRSGRDDLSTLAIPLLAGDTKLDSLGFGLLDCPDIQTHDQSESSPDLTESNNDNPRLDFLTSAARVCSAFLIVWNRAAIRDRLLEIMLRSLRQRMANAPLYLLINMIRPEQGQPQRTLDDSDVQRILEQFKFTTDHVFGAFDFAIEDRPGQPGWRHFTPPAQVQRFDESPAPQFYLLSEGITTSIDLHALAASLDAAEIQQTKIADHQRELERLEQQARAAIQQWVTDAENEISTIHRGLLDTCQELMTDETTGEPLQVMSKQFADALHESLVRTAPFALRIPLKLAKPFDKAYASTRKWLNAFNLKKLTKSKLEKLEGKVKQHLKLGSLKLASSESIAKRMHTQRWCPADIPIQELEKAWHEIFAIFQQHPLTDFDTKLLDSSSRDYWDGFSLMEKFTIGGKALLGTIGGLAAVCGIATLAVDGGATLYAATSVSHAINSGIALAITAGGTTAAMVSFQDSLLKDNTLPYLSRLFAIACDCFRLPRQIRDTPPEVTFKNAKGATTTHRLSTSPELPTFPPITPLTQQRLWNYAENTEK